MVMTIIMSILLSLLFLYIIILAYAFIEASAFFDVLNNQIFTKRLSWMYFQRYIAVKIMKIDRSYTNYIWYLTLLPGIYLAWVLNSRLTKPKL